MDKKKFIEHFKNAFGNVELPIVFWYSDKPAAEPQKTGGCFIKYLKPAREGGIVSLDAETISCPGGKTYTGFIDVPSFIADFVSGKERYKERPEQVTGFINELNIPKASGPYINFASIGQVDDFQKTEGIVFFATPDVLSGLVSWTFFDTNDPDAVSVPFGSGCSSLITQTITENRKNGKRSFLGFFDPSVRPAVESNILCLTIPMSRFKEMYHTINESCLGGTHGWKKVKERINNEL